MRRRTLLRDPAAGPVVGVLGGVGLVIAVFLPWYAANLAGPVENGSASGWESTAVAKLVLAMGVIVALSALLLAADARGVMPLDAGVANALGAALLACSVIAGALVLYRLLVLPDPAEFLQRQVGLWAAIGASALGFVAGVSRLAARG